MPTVSRLRQRVARVRRGRGAASGSQQMPLPRRPRTQGAGAMRVPWGVSQEEPRGQWGPGRPGVGGTAGPNKGVQATANSLRSYVAAAIGGA